MQPPPTPTNSQLCHIISLLLLPRVFSFVSSSRAFCICFFEPLRQWSRVIITLPYEVPQDKKPMDNIFYSFQHYFSAVFIRGWNSDDNKKKIHQHHEREQFSETKDNFTHVPSIHEVDEEETDEEYTYDQEAATPKDVQQIANIIKETADNDSLYSNESFCSDVSCDESEGTNATSRSFNDSHFSSQVIDRKCNKEDKIEEEERPKSTAQGSEAANSVCCESSISEDKLTSLQQIKNRRKNMTFTDEELRKIEWENQLLLRKIMAQQKPKEKILRDATPQGRVSSSAINRKKLQRKIESENILLLQRIQQTKSRVANTITKSGCRQTFL